MTVTIASKKLQKRTATITLEYYSRASLAKDHAELRIRLEAPAIGNVSGVRTLSIINSQSLLDVLKQQKKGEEKK